MDYPEFTRSWPSIWAGHELEHPDPSQLRPAEPGPAPAASDRVGDLLRPGEPAVRPPVFRDWRQTPEGQ
eukprot:13929461-Alexandrium_andersonii.AAC.1